MDKKGICEAIIGLICGFAWWFLFLGFLGFSAYGMFMAAACDWEAGTGGRYQAITFLVICLTAFGIHKIKKAMNAAMRKEK